MIRRKLREIDPYPMLLELQRHKGNIEEFYNELKRRDPPSFIPPGQNLVDLARN